MGIEAKAKVETGSDSFQAAVHLETDEIVLRGDHRMTLRFAEIGGVAVVGERLVLTTPGGPIAIVLGIAEAERWARKIRNPPSRLAKLGIGAETAVHVDGIDDEALFREIEEVGGVLVALTLAEVVLLGVDRPDRLGTIADTARRMAPKAHLWAIRPKGKGAAVSEAEVMRAGREAGLSLSKTLRFSETATGERFTWPKQ